MVIAPRVLKEGLAWGKCSLCSQSWPSPAHLRGSPRTVCVLGKEGAQSALTLRSRDPQMQVGGAGEVRGLRTPQISVRIAESATEGPVERGEACPGGAYHPGGTERWLQKTLPCLFKTHCCSRGFQTWSPLFSLHFLFNNISSSCFYQSKSYITTNQWF